LLLLCTEFGFALNLALPASFLKFLVSFRLTRLSTSRRGKALALLQNLADFQETNSHQAAELLRLAESNRAQNQEIDALRLAQAKAAESNKRILQEVHSLRQQISGPPPADPACKKSPNAAFSGQSGATARVLRETVPVPVGPDERDHCSPDSNLLR
jgi:hypothetical protein